jgi:hypothetical protein
VEHEVEEVEEAVVEGEVEVQDEVEEVRGHANDPMPPGSKISASGRTAIITLASGQTTILTFSSE